MQVSSLIRSNTTVVDQLRNAHKSTELARTAFSAGKSHTEVAKHLEKAFNFASEASKGASELRRAGQNVLDRSFHNYAGHSVRELRASSSYAKRPYPLTGDSPKIFAKMLDDAERSTRLGVASGDRSLASPKVRELAQRSSGSGNAPGSNGSAHYGVDDLDSLGNPQRGRGGVWAGNDGQRFDFDGTPSRGDYDVVYGPDGATYGGI